MTALRSLAVLCAVAVGAGSLAGCSSTTKECTLVGCGFPFRVMFQSDQVGWSPGSYTIAVVSDGVTGSCDLTLPLGSCEERPACTGVRDWILGYGGCGVPAEQQAIYSVDFNSTTPTNVEIFISRDGQQVAYGAFTPVYHSYVVNGSGCGPPCQGAAAAMMLVPH